MNAELLEKECLSVLNSIPYINRGGCGISAYAMYEYLRKMIYGS